MTSVPPHPPASHAPPTGGRARRRRVGRALALALASLGGLIGAHGAAPDATPFIGTWTCTGACVLTANCDRDNKPTGLFAGATLAIRPGTDSDLVLEIGCACRLPLTVSTAGTSPSAALVAPTTCDLFLSDFEGHTLIEAASVTFPDGAAGGAHIAIMAGATTLSEMPSCVSAALVDDYVRTSPAPVTCGQDSDAIAVPSLSPAGRVSCPIGAGRHGLTFFMTDENDVVCTALGSGGYGEGDLVLPQSTKSDPECRPRELAGTQNTTLQLCRVDGSAFKPLTTDPNAVEQFYAVLKMSPEGMPCPNGSEEMIQRIDNEDDGNQSWVRGIQGPNSLTTGGPKDDTATVLHFCYFRAAAPEADTMAGFPDLGFPYAVFHDFEGAQPDWVLMKSWLMTNDQSDGNTDVFTWGDASPATAAEFRHAIEESPTHSITFDMARVR